MGDESDDDSLSPTLFKLSGVDTSLSEFVLEDALSKILDLKATLLETDYNDEEGTILFCCHHDEESGKDEEDALVLGKLGNYIKQQTISPSPESILAQATESTVSIVDEEEDECVEYITEEEAYQLWLEQNECNSENDENDEKNLVSSPDGVLVTPKHNISPKEEEETKLSSQGNPTTAAQLERDPGLLDFDNVERIHYNEIIDCLSERNSTSGNNSWKDDFGSQPVMINGFTSHSELEAFQTSLKDTICQHGTDTIVRTGNRETLITNGFHNSKPASLLEAVDMKDDTEHNNQNDGTIVFNPIHEMPPAFRSVLGKWIDGKNEQMFPNKLWMKILGDETNNATRDPPRFTLCIANEGFGIGMHKHGPALFFLTQGRKKWYLSHPDKIDERINQKQSTDKSSSTHPGFYQELSTHKCIQVPGEMLLVPNLWYHEIYNLASPTIGIQSLADELPTPGTLWSMERKA